MKKGILFLLVVIGFLSCEKEDKIYSITVNYNVGDRYTYLVETNYYYDDTTSLNKDSVSNSIDTMYMEVEKDTLINGSLCKSLKYTRFFGLFRKVYVEQKNDGIYQIATTTGVNSYTVDVLQTPYLLYPNKLGIGTHWGGYPTDTNTTYEVTGSTEVKTSTGRYPCVVVKTNFYPGDMFYGENIKFIKYISSQGLMREEFSNHFTVNHSDMHGYQTTSYTLQQLD